MSNFYEDDRQAIPFDEVERNLGLGEYDSPQQQMIPGTNIPYAEANAVLTGHPLFQAAPTAFKNELSQYPRATSLEEFETAVRYVGNNLQREVEQTVAQYDGWEVSDVLESLEAQAKDDAEYEAEAKAWQAEEAAEEAKEARVAEARQVAESFIEEAENAGLPPEVIANILQTADALMADADMMTPLDALNSVLRLHDEAVRVEDAKNEEIVGTGFTTAELQAALGDEFRIEGADEQPDMDYILTGERAKNVVEDALDRLTAPQQPSLIQDRDAIERMAQAAADAQAARDARRGSEKTGFTDPGERQGTTLGQFLEAEGISMGAPVSDPVTPDAPVDVDRGDG